MRQLIINFNIEPNSVKGKTIFYHDSCKYPIACVDKYSYISQSKIESGVEGVSNFHIGRFCAIAHNVIFTMDLNHDYKSVAMGESELFDFPKNTANIRRKGQIIIQNDVWIGRGATIMEGVVIHNGAVIAANSHVIKDVPPYAIVGGNPAKVIGYRFSSDIISKLQHISWWYWDDKKIKQNSRYFKEDINKFCEMFYEEKDDRRIDEFEKLDFTKKYLYFMDCFDKNPIWQNVIDEFTRVSHKDELLLLYVSLEDYEKCNHVIDEIDNLLESQDIKNIIFYVGAEEEFKYAFKYFDFFITNRIDDTVRYTCYADRYKTKIISGVDIPIFNN